MVDVFTRLLPREVLATFLPDPRSIRAFENLQQDLVDTAGTTTGLQNAPLLAVDPPGADLMGARRLVLGPGLSATDGGAGGDYDLSVNLTATSPLAYDDATATMALVDPVPIGLGGTGQTSAPAAINALLPSQTGNAGKVLTTDGMAAAWGGVVSLPFWADSPIAASQVFLRYVFTQAATLPADLVGWQVKVFTPPAASWTVLVVKNNATTVGTITISTAGVVTLATTGGLPISFAVGDQLLIGGGPADAVMQALNVNGIALL